MHYQFITQHSPVITLRYKAREISLKVTRHVQNPLWAAEVFRNLRMVHKLQRDVQKEYQKAGKKYPDRDDRWDHNAETIRHYRRALKQLPESPTKMYAVTTKYQQLGVPGPFSPAWGSINVVGPSIFTLALQLRVLYGEKRRARTLLHIRDGGVVEITYNRRQKDRLDTRMYKVHIEPGYFVRKMESVMLERFHSYKAPLNTTPHVGLELECYVKASEKGPVTLEKSLLKSQLWRYVMVGTDGSLSKSPSPEHQGIEVRIIAPESEVIPVIRELCGHLRDHNAKVNSTCGFHVHLDCRPEAGRDAVQVFRKLADAQPLLFAMVPEGRRTTRYCRQEAYKVMAEALRVDRYQAINPHSYQRHKTIEVRLHHGTVNPRKILNWFALLRKIMDGPIFEAGLPQTLEALAESWKLGAYLTKYIEERIRQFNPKGALPFLTNAPVMPPSRTEGPIPPRPEPVLDRNGNLVNYREINHWDDLYSDVSAPVFSPPNPRYMERVFVPPPLMHTGAPPLESVEAFISQVQEIPHSVELD